MSRFCPVNRVKGKPRLSTGHALSPDAAADISRRAVSPAPIHPSRRPDFAHDARGPRSPARLDAIDIKGPSREIGGPFRGVSAEFERSLIRERTQAGLAAARPRWSHGRPSTETLTDDDIEAAKAMLANPDIGVTQIAHRLGISPAMLYRHIPAARTANIPGG